MFIPFRNKNRRTQNSTHNIDVQDLLFPYSPHHLLTVCIFVDEKTNDAHILVTHDYLAVTVGDNCWLLFPRFHRMDTHRSHHSIASCASIRFVYAKFRSVPWIPSIWHSHWTVGSLMIQDTSKKLYFQVEVFLDHTPQ